MLYDTQAYEATGHSTDTRRRVEQPMEPSAGKLPTEFLVHAACGNA